MTARTAHPESNTREDSRALAEAALPVLLELLGGPCLLTTDAGRIVRANEAALALLAEEPEGFGGEIRASLRGEGRFTVTTILIEGSPTHLLLVDRDAARTSDRLAELALRARLTPRQRAVLEMLSLGAGNKDIARALGISLKTVEVHVTELFRRTGFRSRRKLLAALLRAGPP